MSKILVTGAGGSIGSHLTEKLDLDGFKIKGFIHYCEDSAGIGQNE